MASVPQSAETAAPPAGPPPVTPYSLGAKGLLIALIGAALLLLLPEPSGLSPEGKRMAAIFFIALVLWATESIPIAVTALLVVFLQPVLGIAELRTAFGNFISPVFFFVFAMFCISTAFTASGLDRRFAVWLLARAGTDTRRVLLAFMVGTATISTIMSDVPACAIFMAAALGLFAKSHIVPGHSRFGKAVMMGIPIASLIGGVATPAGSSVNILGIYFIEQYGGVRVPFLHWMAIGIPMVLVLVPIAWYVLVRCYPPEMQHIGDAADLREEKRTLGPLRAAERKVIGLLSIMIVLWILSTWYAALDVVLIALGGAVAMFLPGIGLLTWKQVERNTGWDTLLMIGGVTSLGAAAVETGLARWMVDLTMGGMTDWSTLWIVAAISAFTVVVHLVLPIGPVVNAVLIPPIALLALSTGQSPVLYALPVAFTASCAFLLPLDAVPLITYSKGYYRMLDMLLPGTIISVFWVIWMTVLMVVVAPWLGLI
jgi:sodium-dependent dicarboxylate transporter 2/3/5